jgi:hypothetical protein
MILTLYRHVPDATGRAMDLHSVHTYIVHLAAQASANLGAISRVNDCGGRPVDRAAFHGARVP